MYLGMYSIIILMFTYIAGSCENVFKLNFLEVGRYYFFIDFLVNVFI